jgi:hypothetical protein
LELDEIDEEDGVSYDDVGVHEFAIYITANSHLFGGIYGQRLTQQALCQAPEDAVDASAHLLLQTRALDGTLRPQFERWYPGLAGGNVTEQMRAAA